VKFHLPLPGLTRMPGTPEWSHDMDAAQFRQVASAIDALGYDIITVPEHLAMPTFELPRLGPYWMDALSAMAFLGGTTSTVRIDASVLVLPYHHPLALAKALSTIDVLSGGRVSICIGVGHAVREFEVLGIPFEERGPRTDEILEAMHVLWTQDEPEYHGRFYDIDGLAFEPRPVQRPGPPIHVGGNSKPALRRAARHDGWISNPSRGIVLSDLPATLDFIRSQPDFAGKEDTFEVSWLRFPPDVTELDFGRSTPAQRAAFRDFVVEQVAVLREHGVTRTGLPVAQTASGDEFVDYLRWFAEDVRPAISG
jgi:probable F420-dependent oxidoreductase